jgi:hypothetical protein
MKKLSLAAIADIEKTFFPDDDENDPQAFKVIYKEMTGEEYLAARFRMEEHKNTKSDRYFLFRNEVLKEKIVRFENLELNGPNGLVDCSDVSQVVGLLASVPSQQTLLDNIFYQIYTSATLKTSEKNG